MDSGRHLIGIEERLRAQIARDVPGLAFPHLELPAGVTDAIVTQADRESARTVSGWSEVLALREARLHLREARGLWRRGAGRPAAKARRGVREREAARRQLVGAALCCAVADMLRAGITPTGLQIARVRERCEEQLRVEQAAFAVRVENWIRLLAGEDRLTRA